MTLLAALLAATAVGLAVPGPRVPAPDGRLARAGRRVVAGGGIGLRLVVSAGVLVGGATASGLLAGVRLALGLVLLTAGLGAVRLVARTRERAEADARQEQVVEVCEALSGELRSGQPPARALSHCAETWPALEPVAAAARLHADVPAALRRLAVEPGAGGLGELATAWQVAAGSGAGLSAALEEIASSAREAEATRQLVRSELASAQATARLVTALPLVSLLLASGIGANPWRFLTATWPGLGCLAAALALAYCGLSWVDRIATAALHG